ncbi:neuropeptides capa receptor [Caerostris darwini]|uniref:Neuropeptides capa receptor n=1 Tax=Caerostris darwini TaxID=1538125 RepID=A0AAV4NLX8_9ARAC|nr:neuropeptides capa receptor [Caerostris darwini]
MPPELYTLWHQYPWQLGTVGCWLRGMVPEATAYASILTIVTFSTERYVAICHPLHQQTRSRLSYAVRNIAAIWLFSAICALPYAFFTQVNQLINPDTKEPLPESKWCGFPFNKPERQWEWLMLCSTFIFFVLPVSVITALYVRIALALHHSRNLHRSTSESAQCRAERERSKARSRRVVIRMLAAVVIAFFVCWAPFHAQRLLFLYVTLYGEWTDTLKHINQNLFTLAGCFYYFNSTINPILYSVMSNRFRVAFREKLCAGPPSLWCICCCCFCCVKDFEKRSQQTPVFCRNSNSHSSVRSCVSYHKTNLITNNNRPRTLAVDYNQKLGVTMSCVHRDQVWTPTSSVRKYGPTLTVSPPISSQQHESSHSHRSSSSDTHRRNCQEASSSSREEEDDLREEGGANLEEELDEALRPELERLEEKESTSDCINCTNCSLLFPQRPRAVAGGTHENQTSTTELSVSEPVEKPPQDDWMVPLDESLV